jgi:outer membrane biosynthesis protein TonB
MITRNNLLTEYPRIFQSTLPQALQQEEFDFIAENFDLYDEDEDIRKYIDTFVEKLNEALEKQENPKQQEKTEKTVIKTEPSKPKSQKSPKRDPKPKPKRETKPQNRKSLRARPATKIGIEVTEFPLPVTFIKSYCGWNGKVKTKTQVYTFIKRLQKAIAERKIRKTSEYAPQIEYMQKRLISFHNDRKSGTKTY